MEIKSHFVGTFVMILNFSTRRLFILPYYVKAFGERFVSTALKFQFWH
jgi:hypothetical protein